MTAASASINVNAGATASSAAAAAAQSAATDVMKGETPTADTAVNVARVAASAAAGAACSAYGGPVAGMACAWVADKLTKWIGETVIPAIGKAFRGIGRALGFGKERPKPTLVPARGSEEWYQKNRVPPVVNQSRIDYLLQAAVERLQFLHNELEVAGSYTTKDVLDRLKAHGLRLDARSSYRYGGTTRPLPVRNSGKNIDYSEATSCVWRDATSAGGGDWLADPVTARIECSAGVDVVGSFTAHWWAPDFRADFERKGGAAVRDAMHFIATTKSNAMRAPVAKMLNAKVEQYDERYVKPWEEKLVEAFTAETIALQSAAIGTRAAEEAAIAARDAAATGRPRAARRPPVLGESTYSRETRDLTPAERAKYDACVRGNRQRYEAFAKTLPASWPRAVKLAKWRDSGLMVNNRACALGIKPVTMADMGRIESRLSLKQHLPYILAVGAAIAWGSRRYYQRRPRTA